MLFLLLNTVYVNAQQESKTFFNNQMEEVQPDLRAKKQFLDYYNQKDKIQSVKKKTEDIEREFLELNRLSISNQTKMLYFADITFLEVHPLVPISIEFPQDIVISHVSVMPETLQPKYQFNLIDITPTSALLKSTVTLKYVHVNDPLQNVKTLKLVIDKYKQDKNKDKELYSMYKVEYKTEIDPIKLLELYIKKYSKNPQNKSSIKIDGVVYQFIEDGINGTLLIENKRYVIKRGLK
jgi:hypothetical protein